MTLPILRILTNGAKHSQRNLVAQTSDHFQLTLEERNLAQERPCQDQGLAETPSAQTRLSRVE